jgi:hypothetical protein
MEQDMDSPRGNRWLLIISLVIGLLWSSLYGSLTIPSIGLLYFFCITKQLLSKLHHCNVVVISILLFIFKLLLPLTMSFFAGTEVFTVNDLGMPLTLERF